MRVHVAFTPAEEVGAPVGIVVDVLRATSTICQALAAGYTRVLCCGEVEEAREVAQRQGDAVLAGERGTVRIPGFDFGNSPAEFVEPAAGTLVLTTTNGTRLLVAAAARCDVVLVGSLLNLDAVVSAVRERGEEVAVLCAGVRGELALDDAYCAGRLAEELGGDPADSALAAVRLAHSYADAGEGLASSQSARNLRASGHADDIAWCARESLLDVVPRFSRMLGSSAEVLL
ncbi:MAG: 2-phosphosulfolactate phosphatase [Candidatus Rokuibacteriota bacterium]|nr:MAG: 2-phosphosulfolactate phosphatase [Candidatus Rokubacteria bacterium]